MGIQIGRYIDTQYCEALKAKEEEGAVEDGVRLGLKESGTEHLGKRANLLYMQRLINEKCREEETGGKGGRSGEKVL